MQYWYCPQADEELERPVTDDEGKLGLEWSQLTTAGSFATESGLASEASQIHVTPQVLLQVLHRHHAAAVLQVHKFQQSQYHALSPVLSCVCLTGYDQRCGATEDCCAGAT